MSHVGPGSYDIAESYLGQQVVSPTLSDIKYRSHRNLQNSSPTQFHSVDRRPQSPDSTRKASPRKLSPSLGLDAKFIAPVQHEVLRRKSQGPRTAFDVDILVDIGNVQDLPA